VAGIERRPIARIEIAYWTERGECSDVDEGIVRHGRPLLPKLDTTAWPGNGVRCRAPILDGRLFVKRLSNRHVGLINERYDIAFRIQSNFETDQSLTLRKLGTSHLVLVAEPSLLAGRTIPKDRH
jgi:hypothetical protein